MQPHGRADAPATLVIERAVGAPFRFDRTDIEEFERVTEILDQSLN